MSREVRRVPKDWQHPKNAAGRYLPIFDSGYGARAASWDAAKAKWDAGERPEYCDKEHRDLSFEEWEGERPREVNYMPDWPDAERTHLQMYETTSEGTPISPVFATPEELAHWLADNKASAFAGMSATYEQWLRVCKGGWAPSGVYTPGEGMQSGVAAFTKDEEP